MLNDPFRKDSLTLSSTESLKTMSTYLWNADRFFSFYLLQRSNKSAGGAQDVEAVPADCDETSLCDVIIASTQFTITSLEASIEIKPLIEPT